MIAWLVGAALLLALILAAWRGWHRGVLVAGAGLVSLIVGLLLAGVGYRALGELLADWLRSPPAISRVLAYIVILALAQLVFMVAYQWLWRRYQLATKLREYRWMGAVVGLVQGGLLAAIMLVLAAALPLTDTVKRGVIDTPITRPLLAFGGYVQGLVALPSQDATQSFTLLTVSPESDQTLELGFTVADVQVAAVAEQRMLELINRERVDHGLEPLVMNDTARLVARAHSRDMFARGYFSHRTPEGADPFDRMRAGKVEFRAAGENLALAPTLPLAHRGLMDSPGHRANILSDNYRTVGIGIVVSRRHGLMVTQNFTN